MTTSTDRSPEGPLAQAATVIQRYAWVIVAAGFLVTWTTLGSGRYLYQVIMPAMKDGLGLSYAPAGALASAIMIGYLASCLISGVLAVKFGFRLIISVSTVGAGLAMVGLAFTSWYPLAFFLLLVTGFGAGGAYIPTTGVVAAWFPPHRRGMFLSITTLGANFGILSAASLGPRIVEAYGGTGWRPAWVYFGVAAIATGIVAVFGMRDRPIQRAGPAGQPAPPARPAILSWGTVFRNRSMLWLTVAYLCHGFFSVYLAFLSAFATRGLGYTTEFSANIWTLIGIMSTLFYVPWGYLSDRLGRKEALIPCALLLLLAILIPIFRQDALSLVISAFLFGVAYTGPMTIITVTAGDLVGPAMAAAAMGLVTMGHGIGQMAGPGIGGVLIDVSGSFVPGFLLAAAGITAEIAIISRLRLPQNQRR